MKYHLVMVVWGDPYLETMLKVTIPMLLSNGNIPALSNLSSSDITFYTRPQDERKIHDSPLLRELRRLLAIKFVHVDPTKEKSKYRAMAKAQWTAALRARAEGARCLMLGPDFVIADGSLATVDRLAMAGKRVVMSLGVRLKQESMLMALDAIPRQGLSITLNSRQLVRLALDHLHPAAASAFFNSDKFTSQPTFCLWPMNDGFLVRGFHLHPVMIDLSESSPVRNLDILRTQASDGHFTGQAVGRWSDVHVETDSDNFFMCSLHPAKASDAPSASDLPAQDTVRAMAYHSKINPLHRAFFMQAIRMHSQELDDNWDKLEDESGRWAFDALSVSRDTEGAQAITELRWRRNKHVRKGLKAARAILRMERRPPEG